LMLMTSICATLGNAQALDTPVTVSYPVRFKTPAEIEKVFAPLVANSSNVQLTLDHQHRRLTVTGPPWAHELFKQVVERVDIQQPTPNQKTGQNAWPPPSAKPAGAGQSSPS